jgi:trk system potassium uptake protein TrkA
VRIHVVVGLGQFGEQVARGLAAAGSEVIAVDSDMRRVEEIKDAVARAVRADCTSEAAMRAIGAAEAHSAVIALGEQDFEAAVLGTASLKSLGVKTVIARASDPQRGRILALAGASRVVYPEAEMGERVANLLMHPSLSSAARLPSGFGLAEFRAPPAIEGKTLVALNLRQIHALTVVAVVRGGSAVDATAELELKEGDHLLVAGRMDRLDALARSWDLQR